MNLINKTDKYALYEYGESMESLDGQIKISIANPREDFEIVTESSIGYSNTLLAYSKLARTIEKGDVPEIVCRAS